MCRPGARCSGYSEQTDLTMPSQNLRCLWMGWRETQVHIATRDKGDEWKVWVRKANDRGI